MNAPNGALAFTPSPATSRGDQEETRWGAEPKWYTVAECAALCKRHPRTVLNLLSRHQLPRKSGWLVYRRRRRKVIVVKPAIAAWLVEVTLLNNAQARMKPPR